MQLPTASRTFGDRRLVGPYLAVMAWSWLGLAVLPAAAQSSEPPARLQSLVDDAVAQLQLSYRHDAAEQKQRYEQLGAAVAAWNASPQRDVDNQQMAAWLRGAIRSSMPGSRRSLPALPEFDRAPALVESAPAMQPMAPPEPVEEAPVATTLAKPVTDDQPEPAPEPVVEPVAAEPMTEERGPSEPLFGESDDSGGIDWLFGDSQPATPASDEPADEASGAPTIPVVPPAGLDFDEGEAAPPADTGGMEFGADFWSEHPAAEPMPNDFFSGDPFRDDAPPSDE